MRWELLLLAALLVVVALVGVGWSRRARLRDRIPARRAPRLRHPVILAHGMLGFDEIAVAGRRHQYFRKIADGLSGLDAKFHTPRVPAAAPIAVRAEQLRALVQQLPSERVNVIAHSMGGLDARYAISRLGLRDRVASLVTIGTPHQGTPVADLGAGIVPAGVSRALSRVLDVRALHDLTTDSLERFNREVPDAPGVAYCSVVGRSALTQTNPLLWPSHAYLSARSGANDGLVPSASQGWGKVIREIEADHWAQIGWSRSFDAVGLYEDILRELVGLGF
ncbi:MAG TPA: alpha/beta fold hydrolase [Myxococcales bacterium]|nr:alpha/beta fold hydrolase [Myxococcales bacterium]